MPDSPLIATKLVQPVYTELLARPRLYTLLDSGAGQPLTLVSAPPGFGKTMLVTGWIYARVRSPVAWLSLDDGDDQMHVFWRYLIAALQTVSPGLGDTALQLLAAPAPPAVESILATLINELVDLPDDLILVLDDYHQIQALEIHNSLVFLLDHMPRNFHLFLLTREDPPLGLARRRARRQMVEIRAGELRFSIQECGDFLRTAMGLQLSGEQVGRLERSTEGWIVGLQMAALSLQGADADAFFRGFSGDDRYITDYLIEEVLQIQPEEVRTFLLKTSILERMSDPLCTALVGSQGVTLAALERSNLFIVPLDTSRTWYRYHHLFADLLRQRLTAAYPAEEIARLRCAASTWFENHTYLQEAIRFAQQIPDMERVGRLLEEHAVDFYLHNELPQLAGLARTLPQAVRARHPWLCMAVAWALVATYQDPEEWLAEIERIYGAKAEAALSDSNLERDRRAALLEVLIARLQSPLHDYRTIPRDALLAIREQFDRLPPDQVCLFNTVSNLRPVLTYNLGLLEEAGRDIHLAGQYFQETISLSRRLRNFHLLHFALGHLASLQMNQSHLNAARQTYEEALAELQAGSISPYVSVPQAGLGALYYEWGDLTEAERHYQEALTLARLWNHWESLVPALCGLARIRRRQGDPQAAFALLEELSEVPYASMRLGIEALRGLWQAQNGELQPAETWLEANQSALKEHSSPMAEPAALDGARLMLALERVEAGTALAAEVSEMARAEGRMRPVIQGLVIQARGLALEGREPEALAALREALALAEPENYFSSFVDEGGGLGGLLAKLGGHAYAAMLFSAMGAGVERSGKREAADLLSERELEVIRLVAEGLSNQQIAERLVISLPTVKTHVGNIYNKLGVENRAQAVGRARALGLIPRG